MPEGRFLGALIEIESGSLADSEIVNDNFEYLDGRITTVGSSITTLQANIQSLNSTLSNQINQLETDIENTTSAVYQYSGGDFTLKEMVVADSLNTNTSSVSDHEDAVWLYATPVYPYVPLTTQTSGTSHTFTNGGVVICTSATNVTVGESPSSITFTGFVGMLPVPIGAVVTTSQTAYFANY